MSRRLIVAALAGLPMLCLAPARGATRAEAFARIVREAPRGGTERAAWLRREAEGTTDARLAFELMEEVTRRAPAEAAGPARLWLVRYWMAAGRTDRALLELELLGKPAPETAWTAETEYWRALLGLEERPAAVETGSVVPWGVMAGIAALRAGAPDRETARQAFALEGAARRAGLLGPWLWNLARSDEPVWQRSVRETLAGGGRALAAAPERVGLIQAYGP
jgi:hypothetical protein